MAITPVAASAQTRAATSPVFNNSGNLMQGERSDEELRSAGRMRDGRVWSDEARAWVDADGRRWLLDDGKWYPIRGRLLPVLFLSAIAALAVVAATSDNQSPGAN
ncbi:hypothetical protein [Altererythrobacter lutimaris]|uniref:Uncharacterized protein n=1 Tax=Altererythrobacter lutimaris TaxID=2743979 RepID=A0A850HET1_9SPHN|nr:hypothetical protein [Altererythrobacter lutimaris]NVE95711.1 hypothetical protein [Altererythrobacter lutimaris]